MTHRFFIPSDWINPPTVTLHNKIARQIRTVLRMQPGAEIIVLDNSGTEWLIRLTEVSKDAVQGQIVKQQPARGEPKLELTLYQGTLKGQKFEWVLQKGTELGVSRFVPVICQRSVVSKPEAVARKQDRWQRIIQEAAEQSGRGLLPRLEPALPLVEAIQHTGPTALKLMFWEEAGDQTLKEVLSGTTIKTVAVFIGPEGGFTAKEADLAEQTGFHIVSLGPRILRAETAGLAACSAIFYEMGDWA